MCRSNLKKHSLFFLISLLSIILLTGCSSASFIIQTDDFTLSDTGYIFKYIPFGSSANEIESDLNCNLKSSGVEAADAPFEGYQSYTTENPIQFLDLEGSLDMQFTADGLYSITFNTSGEDNLIQQAFSESELSYTQKFGEPIPSEASRTLGSVTYSIQQLRWNDTDTGTMLQLAYTTRSDNISILQIGVAKPPVITK